MYSIQTRTPFRHVPHSDTYSIQTHTPFRHVPHSDTYPIQTRTPFRHVPHSDTYAKNLTSVTSQHTNSNLNKAQKGWAKHSMHLPHPSVVEWIHYMCTVDHNYIHVYPTFCMTGNFQHFRFCFKINKQLTTFLIFSPNFIAGVAKPHPSQKSVRCVHYHF